MSLLSVVLDFLFPPRNTEALVADTTADALGTHVRARMIDTDTVSLLPYRIPIVKACIKEAKFNDHERAQTLLGHILADYLRTLIEEECVLAQSSYVLVPIPLSRERYRERGYNQTERIALKAIVQLENVTISTTILTRAHNTLPQTSLGRAARAANMQAAFRVKAPIDTSYTYIVLDDVYTTGATLRSAIDTLRTAGAGRVLGLSLAH